MTSLASDYEFELHLHSEELDPPEAAADAALLPVVAAAKTTRPIGAEYDFTGATSGGSIWLLPKSQNPAVLYLSIGTEELTAGDFASPLTWSLTSVTGSGGGAAPGAFSVWNSGAGSSWATVTPLMSTVGGTPNAFTVSVPAHTHFNYGFTAPGLYNVEFSVSALLAAGKGGGTAVGSATYSFGVFDTGSDYQYPVSMPWTYQGQSFSVALVGNEHIDMGVALVPVPEPSGAMLAIVAATGLVWAGMRRRSVPPAAGRSRGVFWA
ncbi:MAG: choice-of-anchor M domain-containing protein [Planctomycetia bacterium]